MQENKYKQVMDHVEVDEPMKARILANIMQEEIQPKRKMHRSLSWKKIGAPIMVFAVLLFFVTITWQQSNEESPVTSETAITEVYSIEELSEKVGFEVETLSVPYEVEEISYLSFYGEIAEVLYTGENHTLTYRQSESTDDNSGDYSLYEIEETWIVENMTISAKGTENGYSLIAWNDGTYSYSIASNSEFSKEEWITIIESIVY